MTYSSRSLGPPMGSSFLNRYSVLSSMVEETDEQQSAELEENPPQPRPQRVRLNLAVDGAKKVNVGVQVNTKQKPARKAEPQLPSPPAPAPAASPVLQAPQSRYPSLTFLPTRDKGPVSELSSGVTAAPVSYGPAPSDLLPQSTASSGMQEAARRAATPQTYAPDSTPSSGMLAQQSRMVSRLSYTTQTVPHRMPALTPMTRLPTRKATRAVSKPKAAPPPKTDGGVQIHVVTNGDNGKSTDVSAAGKNRAGVFVKSQDVVVKVTVD